MGKVSCNFNKVLRVSFLGKETNEERLEGKGLGKCGKIFPGKGGTRCKGLGTETHLTYLMNSKGSRCSWDEVTVKESCRAWLGGIISQPSRLLEQLYTAIRFVFLLSLLIWSVGWVVVILL